MDDLAMPNAFAIPKNVADITLADIENIFPLEGGGEAYYFRFKYKYGGNSVWLDLSNKTCKVPKIENRIIMKVTRKHPKNCKQYQVIEDAVLEEEPQSKKVSTQSDHKGLEEFFGKSSGAPPQGINKQPPGRSSHL